MTQDARALEELLLKAALARSRGSSSEEVRLLDQALKLNPAEPRVLNARGMRALADGDNAHAQACFAAAAAADPGEPALWINAATASRALGDDGAEERNLERALSIDRRHFVAQLRMAELHERRGRRAGAAFAWSAVVQLAEAMEERPAKVADALARGKTYLATHREELGAAVEAELGEDLEEENLSTKRFQACVDHVLGRRTIYRNECAGVYYPFLPADEFFDRKHFPWLPSLESQTSQIRNEALALLRKAPDAIRPYVRMEAGTPDNKWSPLDNSLEWSACFLWEHGVKNEAVCALCPQTAAALSAVPQNNVPGKAPSAFFSILRPGAYIPPHTGVTNTRAIIHLPLVVPPACGFRVGGETRTWEEGKAFAFDDTIEHEAWNESSETRIVLIFDVWNPHLTPDEQQYLAKFFELVEKRK
jgi:aspartyl/asparaginyl beta-hydroxylase (cupin superfamily)